MSQAVAIPTELKAELGKSRIAQALYTRLSRATKQAYSGYVIQGQTHKDRLCRAKYSIRAVLGLNGLNAKQCQ